MTLFTFIANEEPPTEMQGATDHFHYIVMKCEKSGSGYRGVIRQCRGKGQGPRITNVSVCLVDYV